YRICGDEIDRLKTLPGGNPPTTKQLAAAERVAVRLGIDLPDAVRQDFTQCSQFLDEHFRREG
ncbi:MAG: hypothetical protein OXE48_05050, partial [Gammaproteobacteria bacterium]|nr:hypothetical protein [Gammaproteobacteria bacterium]